MRAAEPLGLRRAEAAPFFSLLQTGARPRLFGTIPQIAPRSLKRTTQRQNRRVEVKTTIQAETELEQEIDSQKFNWFKQWWPVQFVQDLNTDRPNRIELLGEFFVVWKSKSGEWATMKDMCPHRLAPLSEGRVEEDGTLMCSYHGWRFNECGKCVKIPQADDTKALEAAIGNQRSSAKTFPCKVAGHVLWIWPDGSDENYNESKEIPLPMSDDDAAAVDKRVEAGWDPGFSAIMPYTYEELMENLVDPSHFPFAHHGTLFGTRDMAIPLNMRSVEPREQTSVSAVEYTLHLGPSLSRFEFMPPNVVSQQAVKTEEGSGFRSRSLLMGTPINSTSSRLFLVTVFSWLTVAPPFLLRLFPWIGHLGTLKILAGDTIILHAQGQNLRRTISENGSDSYYLPTSADLFVRDFRNWLATKAGGGPMQSEGDSSPLSRNEILDRYQSHVSTCKICQAGLRFVKRVKNVCGFFSQLSVLIAVALLARSMRGALAYWKVVLPLIPFCLFAFIKNQINEKIIPQFYFVDYVHADKN